METEFTWKHAQIYDHYVIMKLVRLVYTRLFEIDSCVFDAFHCQYMPTYMVSMAESMQCI